MPIGTKWIIKIETTEGIGNLFLEAIIKDMIGTDDNGKSLISKIDVECLKEFSEEEYKKHNIEMKNMHEKHNIMIENL